MLHAGSSIGIEKDDDTYFARLLFAEFFKRVAKDDITKAWYNTLRGNCAMSINRLLGLSPRSYAALLLASDFVSIGKRSNVQVNTTALKEWTKKDHYGLGGDRRGCAEHTQSNVVLQNINPTAEKGKKKDHHLIRIGYYYEEGETIVASKAINDGATPPPLTHRLRTIQRWFSLNIRDIISKQYQNEKLEQIEEWVRAKELGLDDQITYSYNLEPRKDTKQSPVANAAVPLITPTTTAAQTKDADGDNGEGTRKYDMGPNYQDAIPKMTKDKTKHEMTQDAVLDILDRYGLQVKFNDSPENDVDVDYYSDEEDDDDEESYIEEQAEGTEYNDDFEDDYPLLSQIAMPIFDLDYANPMNKLTAKFNRQNMLRELTTLMQSYDEPLTFESLNSRGTTLLPVGNKPLNDVLEEMIEQTEQGDDDAAVKTVLQFLTENYGNELRQELRRLKLIPRLLDKYDIAALIDHANIDVT